MSKYLVPLLAAVLNKINQATTTSPNLTELLDSVLHSLEQLLPYSSAKISLWNAKTEQLVEKSSTGPLASDMGCASRIARERAPLLLDETVWQSAPANGPVTRSYAGFPLFAGSEFIGTLELFSEEKDAFPAETLDILPIVGNYVAVSIENARLSREMLLRTEEMATLNTLSAAINASLNLDELLEIIVFSVSQAIGCDRAAIFLMDNERRELSLAKSRNLSVDFVRQNQNIRPQLEGNGQVVLDRYPLVVRDIGEVERPAPYVSLMEQEGIYAFVDLPLRGREHVLGALTVYYDQPHTLEESELELLRSLANQVTLALENARLYERTDQALARQIDQLAAIEEIGRELTSTLDITRVFNLVLQRAMGTTGASAGLLALCDASDDGLELIVDRGYPPETLGRHWANGWPTAKGIVGRVARTGETALVNDVHADSNYIAHLPDTSAQLIVPIIKELRVQGVVSLESSRAAGFSPDDVRFTTQLAELAAIAIDNARLFQQVRDGRDNLQAILDSTHEGILVIGRDNRIVLANPMIEELSDLSAQALVGLSVGKLGAELGPAVATLLGYPASEVEQVLNLLNAKSNQVTKRNYEMLGPPPRHIEQVATPVIDRDGGVVGRLIVFRDVTEEHRVALMRRDLTDMIIHDLRSPLTAVVGGVQVAGDLLESSADTMVIRHALEMANQSCTHLMSLVDSLLDISRLEAGQMPLERHPVLLPQLAQSVIQQMRPLAERETVTLELNTVPETPAVFADSELINRVLVNLVDNALKHSPHNGAVAVEIIRENENGEHRPTDTNVIPAAAVDAVCPTVRCTVLDMGPGIPGEYRQRVFERFAQLDGRRRGKGLGLAFCKLAVQTHGGQIWVEDNPKGQGSAFCFTLPVVPRELFSPDGLDSTR